MILIFVEDTYSHSGWCQDLVDGLVSELKMKRMAFRFIHSIEEMNQSSGYIYVIGSSTGWIRTVLKDANRVGIYPILLCNQAFHELDVRYSTVCSDTNGSMHHLVDTLIATGRTRIALYGTNPHSVSDESRKKAFYYAIGQEDQRDVYINDGSMERCFRSFQGTMADYDAVICANDFTAISLVRNLLAAYPQELERLLMAVTLLLHEWHTDGNCQKQLFEYILEYFFRSNTSRDSGKGHSEQLSGIQKAILYMEVHFREKITLPALAQQAGLHPNYFSELFRKVTGKTYIEKLNQLRIDYACVLLRNGFAVSNACFSSGFGSLSNFLATFKARFGISPNEYKQLHAEKIRNERA